MINIILITLWTSIATTTIANGSPTSKVIKSTVKPAQSQSIETLLLASSSRSPNYCSKPICYKNSANGEDLGCFDPWPLTIYGTLDLYSVCPQKPSQMGTTFNIYYSSKPDVMTRSYDAISPSDKIVFFIPGYKNVYNDSRFIKFKDEIISVVDVVILVDFASGANPGITSRVTDFYDFHQAAANTQVVGRQVAMFINSLKLKKAIDYANIHLICFSLGTQVGHFMGLYASTKYGFQVGRITGLDPPGILIFGPGKRLGPSDASFVDVIHTTSFSAPWDLNKASAGKVGTSQQLGHVDFYPNGGGEDDADQPGCSGINWCSHAFSIDLMKASIHKCVFPASQCSSSNLYSTGQCNQGSKGSRLGYYSNKYPGRGRFYLTTSQNPLLNC